MLLKSFLTTFVFIITCNIYANNNAFPKDKWKYEATATGNSTGHIGDLVITNQTDGSKTFRLGSFIIPPENGKQGYAVYADKLLEKEFKANETYVHQLKGYCINVDLPPVTKGEGFPKFSKWLQTSTDTTIVYINDGKNKTINFYTDLVKAVPLLLGAVKNLENSYSVLKNQLQMPDVYSKDSIKTSQSIVQQAFWKYSSTLQGKTYVYNDFETMILSQETVKNWLKKNGDEMVKLPNKTLRKKAYFISQVSNLWEIISLVPKKSKILIGFDKKEIQFEPLWEEVALTGILAKSKSLIQGKPDKTNDKKLWPWIAGGALGVGTIATIAVTSGDKGCMDKDACNYNADAKKQDGTCQYNDCLNVCGGNTIVGVSCDDGDEITANDVYTSDCTCVGKPIYGCTDTDACNYNINATVDDGSCETPPCKPGCTDLCAPNYDAEADIDDGSCEVYDASCNSDCNMGDITAWNPDSCNCELRLMSMPGCTTETACNYNPDANCEDGSCKFDPCDPICLKTGTIRYNENCTTDIVGGCKIRPYYLIEYGEKLLSAKLNSEDKCFYGYDGQTIKFNYEVVRASEIDASYICSDIATPVEVTCFIPEEGNCENKEATIKFLDCSCDNTQAAFLETPAGEILEFFTPDCSSFGTNFYEGDTYKLDYYEGVIEPGCDIADKLVIVTCMEKILVVKSNENEAYANLNKLSPFVENRILNIPIQNSEFPETTVSTNILGINYYQPISPTIFIENQTSVGYATAADLFLLNNKITINAKNEYLPIHYGLGYNALGQLETFFVADWQGNIIWNIGTKFTIAGNLKLEAEFFKSFNSADPANYTIKLLLGMMRK